MASSAVEEIKARLDVADVVSAHVALRRSGRSLKGLCPFHAERTPSFYVFPETGTWKCFGCGEGGDVFSFLQKRENLDFGEALRVLAAKVGVELPERRAVQPEVEALGDRLRGVLAGAEVYFQGALSGGAGEAARGYLARRGVSPESVVRFGLGYAPPSGLIPYLREAGFSADEAIAAGLAGKRDDGSLYEMFRQRVIFPIRDASGRIVAFGGRTIGDTQPKYLNGPQTPIFDKGSCLFGLDLARTAVRQSGQAIIVEGYMDTVIAHQYGFSNVVATLGTALTEHHLPQLGRRAKEIVLALDADAAGQAATLRGLEVAQNAPADDYVPVPVPGIRGLIRYQAVRNTGIKVLTLPADLDPDDLIRRDPTEFGRLVGAALPVVDFVLSRLGARHDLASPAGKREAVQEAMRVIRDLTDPVEREHYLQRLARLIGVDESSLRAALRQFRPRPVRPFATPLSAAEAIQVGQAESYVLALHFLAPSASGLLEPDDLRDVEARGVYALIATLEDTPRVATTLAELAAHAGPGLERALADVAAWLPRIEHLPPDQLTRELDVATLKLRQDRLRLEHSQVVELLQEDDPASERSRFVSLLAAIAAQLREIEAALASRHAVGSVVWRSRQVGEVLGG